MDLFYYSIVNRKSAHEYLSQATPEGNVESPNLSPTPSSRRLSNPVGLIPSSPLVDPFEATIRQGIGNSQNQQDQSDSDDEEISERASTTSSNSTPTQPPHRKHLKNTVARPKRKVRRPHSRPSCTISNSTDQTPDSSPHQTNRYSKGKQPARNGCSPPRLSFITPNQTDPTPETSPHRPARFNKGKQPARNNTYTFSDPIDPNPEVGTPSFKTSTDNHTNTNERESIPFYQQFRSAPEFSNNRHRAPSPNISTRMETSIEKRLSDLEKKVNFLESSAGDRDVDFEALHEEVEVVRQRLDVTLRDVHISLRNARRNQGGQVNEEAQQHEGERNNQRDVEEATPQAKKTVLRVCFTLFTA